MTKQYFSTLLKRVSVISLMGIVLMLLVVACPAPSGGEGGSIGAVPTPPVLGNVSDSKNGGLTISFQESNDVSVRFTLITAKSIDGHIVTAKVPRSLFVGDDATEVVLRGLKDGVRYDITLQAVSKDGVNSKASEKGAGAVMLSDDIKAERKKNFIGVTVDDDAAAAVIASAIQKKLQFLPQVDSKTSATSIKIGLTNIPALSGIDKVELLAVDASVTVDSQDKIEAASNRAQKSKKETVKEPKSNQVVLIKGLRVAPVSNENSGKVNIFYRLHDINDIKSNWISTGPPVKPQKAQAGKIKFSDNGIKTESQSITSITWEPVKGHQTHVLITNTDLGIKMGSAEVKAGTKTLTLKDTPLSSLQGRLLGKSTYKITLKTLKDGIYGEGVSQEVTVPDTTGPTAKFPNKNGADITLTLIHVGGKFLKVGIDQLPFDYDYARTEIKILLNGKHHKDITLKKGTKSKRFEINENGKYAAKAIFYDIIGNASKKAAKQNYTLISKEINVADITSKPKTAEIKISKDQSVTKAERSKVSDDVVTVTWALEDKSKSAQVDKWTVAAIKYQSYASAVGAVYNEPKPLLSKKPTEEESKKLQEYLSKKAKQAQVIEKGNTVDTRELTSGTRSVRFTGLSIGYYVFLVSGKDIFDNQIDFYTFGKMLGKRVPADLKDDDVAVIAPKDTKGTIRLEIKKPVAPQHTTHISLTLKKDGKVVVKGYENRKYKYESKIHDLKPLEPGKYTATLQAYSNVLLKYSKETKTVSPLDVKVNALKAPEKGIDAVKAEVKGNSLIVDYGESLQLSDGNNYGAIFGKNYDETELSDARFEFFYAQTGAYDEKNIDGKSKAGAIASVATKSKDSKKAGKIFIPNKASLNDIKVESIEIGKLYVYFLRTIHSLDKTKTVDGSVGSIHIANPPSPLKSVSVKDGKGKIIVNVTATENFGTAKDGGAKLDANTVEYIFYYAKKGESINNTSVNDDLTVDEMIALLDSSKDLDLSRFGNKTLTSDAGLGSDLEILSLLPGEYYYVVRVQETAAPDNGSNTAKKSVVVTSAAVAVKSVPAPKFADDGANNKGFTTENIEGAVLSDAKKSDGTKAEAKDIEYEIYFASSSDKAGFANAEALKNAALNNSSDTAGVETVAVGSPFSVKEKNFEGKVYVMVAAIIKSDPSKVTFSKIVFYGSLAKAGMGNIPITVDPADAPGSIKIILDIPDNFDYGTDKDGNKLTKDQVKFWAYYMQTPDKVKVSKIVEDSASSVGKNNTVGTDKVNGAVELDLDDLDTATVTGLNHGKTYYVGVRIIHPDATAEDAANLKASDYTEFAFDTDTVAVITKEAPASAATGTAPLIEAKATGAEGAGEVLLTLKQLVNLGGGTDKDQFGIKSGGTAASVDDIEYWGYYNKKIGNVEDTQDSIMNKVKVKGSQISDDPIITGIGNIDVSANQDFGVFKIAAVKNGQYKIKGLEDGATYSFFVRQVRTDGKGYDEDTSNAGTVGVNSNIVTVITKQKPVQQPQIEGGDANKDQNGGDVNKDQNGGGANKDQNGGGANKDQNGGGANKDQNGGGANKDQNGGDGNG